MDTTEAAKPIEPMKFTIKVKTFFGGFKPIETKESTDLQEIVDYALQHCNGKNHVMITTYQEGMRDMEFLLLFQKASNEFTIRTNGKHIDNKPASEVFTTVSGYLGSLLKPLPELVVLSKEEMEQRWAEKDKAAEEESSNDKPQEDHKV